MSTNRKRDMFPYVSDSDNSVVSSCKEVESNTDPNLKTIDRFLIDNPPEYLLGTDVLVELIALSNRREARLMTYEDFLVEMRVLFKRMQELKNLYDAAERRSRLDN